MARAKAGVEHPLGHFAIPIRVWISRFHHDLPGEPRAILLSEGWERSVWDRKQQDVTKGQRILDRAARRLRPALRYKSSEVVRVGGS
jgi:hypothetical protein